MVLTSPSRGIYNTVDGNSPNSIWEPVIVQVFRCTYSDSPRVTHILTRYCPKIVPYEKP